MKNVKKIIIGIFMMFLVSTVGYCQDVKEVMDAPNQLNEVKNGAYFFAHGYSTTVLELKDGQFRYWFKSDVVLKSPLEYPLKGKYVVKQGAVTLLNEDVLEKEWTFMSFDGKITLWRPAAIKYWEESKKVDGYGVLFPIPTSRTPEEAWEGKIYPVVRATGDETKARKK